MPSAVHLRRMSLVALTGLAGLLLVVAITTAWPASPDVDVPTRDAPRDGTATTGPGATPQPADTRATVTGRCVDAITLAPIAGCEIALSGHADRADPWSTAPPRTWDLDTRRTDAEGRFRFELTPPAAASFLVSCRADGYAGGNVWVSLQPGDAKELADFPLRRGATVSGRVVDTRGDPQPGVKVTFERTEWRIDTDCTSAADGTFLLADRLIPGTWLLEVGAKVALRSPLTIEVADDVAPVDVTVVVFTAGEVPENTGTVVDEADQPIAGVRVRDDLVTDAAGRFRHPLGPVRRWGWNEPERVWYHPAAPGFVAELPLEEFAAGTRDITLRMRRAPPVALDVIVVDAEGNAVSDYEIVCAKREPERAGPPRWKRGWLRGWTGSAPALGPHAGGRARLEGLTSGPHLVAVRPGGERSCLVESILVELPHAAGRLEVRLPMVGERVLEVVFADGTPVVGSHVELLDPLDTTPLTVALLAVDSFQDWHPWFVANATTAQTAHTDADGRVVLRGPAERALAVRIVGRAHLPEIRTDVRLSGAPLRVTLPPGRAFVGRLPAALAAGLGDARRHPARDHDRASGWPKAVHDLCGWDRYYGLQLFPPPRVWLRVPGDNSPPPEPVWDWRTLPPVCCFPIDADGRFRIDGIPPDDWEVRLSIPAGSSQPTVSLTLDTVRALEAHATQRVAIDAVRLEPGEVRASLRADDRPWADRAISLRAVDLWADGVQLWGSIECRTDPHGHFTARLLPGRWSVSVRAQNNADAAWVTLPEDVEVRPGDTIETAFAFTRRRLTLHVVDTRGEPRRFERVRVDDGHESLVLRTDGDGRAVLDPALSKALTLSKETPGMWSRDTPTTALRMPAEPRHPEVTVQVR